MHGASESTKAKYLFAAGCEREGIAALYRDGLRGDKRNRRQRCMRAPSCSRIDANATNASKKPGIGEPTKENRVGDERFRHDDFDRRRERLQQRSCLFALRDFFGRIIFGRIIVFVPEKPFRFFLFAHDEVTRFLGFTTEAGMNVFGERFVFRLIWKNKWIIRTIRIRRDHDASKRRC